MTPEQKRLRAHLSGEPVPDEGMSRAEALAQMGDALGLDRFDVQFTNVRLVGNGAKASVDLTLSNGEVVTFETVHQMSMVKVFANEMTMAVGATLAPKNEHVLAVIALLKRAAAIERTMSDDDDARNWGLTYLQTAKILAVDVNAQVERWRAFSYLANREPGSAGVHVLEDYDGNRYVRTGWFTTFARQQDPRAGSNAAIATRMERVGWSRRGSTGRIKATDPESNAFLVWAFFVVPKGWEGEQGEGAE